MRSMFSAVSSLKAHQLRMDVIGNNIANVNTVGFKSSRVTFQEVFNQTLKGAGRPQEGGRGGTNPQQVGLGISVSSMDTFHTRGSAERTDKNTDVMINGDGFFMVSDSKDGANKNYTRAGNFYVDTTGNLVTANGYHVLGYNMDEDGKFTDELGGIQISKSVSSEPKATDKVAFDGNINSDIDPAAGAGNDGGTFNSTMKVFDSLGNEHDIELQFERTDDGSSSNREFNVTVASVNGESTATIGGGPIKLEFDEAGKLTATSDDKLNLTVDDGGGSFEGAAALYINIDLSDITNYAAESDATASVINGYSSGKLEEYAISPVGEVEAVFSNGDVKIIGKIALANFNNPAGLEKTGSNMYRQTSNSGQPQFGHAGMGGFGELNPGNLEMSNVDLSREFTDMITTQRGFQANSRVITTSDEMLQELVNMKR